jgi:hypothetical protein
MNDQALIVIGENNTPALPAEFQEVESAALETSALIAVVRDANGNRAAEAAAAQITALIKGVEKSRKAVKEPFLEACRRIDATAAAAVARLKAEEIRLNAAIGDYQAEQLAEARRKEVARQEELRRIAEEEAAARRRIEESAREEERQRQEALRKAEEARQAELRKLAEAEAAAKSVRQRAENERRRAQLEEQRKAWEAEGAQAKRIADEAAAAELKRQSELAAQAAEAVGPQATIAKVAGQVVKPVWKFDLVNIWELVRARPDLVRVEENRAAINEAVTQGLRECKGLRIYEDVSISRRKLSGQAAIEV